VLTHPPIPLAGSGGRLRPIRLNVKVITAIDAARFLIGE
jgi:hypothetical protein